MRVLVRNLKRFRVVLECLVMKALFIHILVRVANKIVVMIECLKIKVLIMCASKESRELI